MAASQLTIHSRPELTGARMVLGLSGWMDGGDVSTGTVECLIDKLQAEPLAEIQPQDFYVYSFPGTMEISAMFRPFTMIEDGLITELRPPTNVFHCAPANNLILFRGKEPNLQWERYADCIFSVASEFGVKWIYFIGSVAGVVPHTRKPRLFSSVSDESVKKELERYGVRFSDYTGPASIATYLTHAAAERGFRMATLVAEIPAYIQGRNPRCIETVLRHLAVILDLPTQFDDLRIVGDAFDEKLNEIVQQRSELSQLIHKLEGDYDSEVFDTQMGDLKVWLEQQGIRLD